ncbi:MAG: hypothetical protein Q7I93_03080 [Syntrophales bacterium]|nr:hypothetical protein [Syntrophales bacterium]
MKTGEIDANVIVSPLAKLDRFIDKISPVFSRPFKSGLIASF